jgi:hypothetical protein
MLAPLRHTLITLALLTAAHIAVAAEPMTTESAAIGSATIESIGAEPETIVPYQNPCALTDMYSLLKTPELRNGLPQYATIQYRGQLIRFVNGYYRKLAEDILQGAGERLDSLHKTMGSKGDACTHHYRDLLLASGSSEDFAMALWDFRQATP